VKDGIGVGIIGAGFIGVAHARAIAQTPGVYVAAVCRRDPGEVAAFAAVHGGTAYTDYRDLLRDPAVAAVLVATPHHLHEVVACDAARAGRPIMLEKPMAPDVAACDRILAAVAQAGVLLMPGHTMRFTLGCRRAAEVVRRDGGGPVRYVSAAFAKPWMEPNRRDWHLRADTGGGMLLTAGIHALDRAIFLGGRDVTHVSAIIETAFHDQAADDAALLLLRFAGGGGAQVASIGTRDGATVNTTEIYGAGATWRLDFTEGLAKGCGGRWDRVPDSAEQDFGFRAICRQWAEFAAALRGEAALPVTGEQGRHVIAVIQAAVQSARLRREVAVEARPRGVGLGGVARSG